MSGVGASALLVLALCFTFNMLGRGVGDAYTVFVLPLGAEFGWTRSQVSSVYSVYLVVTGLVAPATGALFDRWGPRLVYPLGLACLGAGCLLAGSLTALWQFQLCIGLLGGMGVSALGMVPASSLIRRWFRRNMSTAIGVAYAGFGSGSLVIVPLSQYLIVAFGWRETYRLLGGTLLVLAPLVLFLLPWKRLAAGAPDEGSRTGTHGAASAPRRPLSSVFRTREYWLLVQVFTFTSLAMYTMIVQTVAYLVEIGFPPLQAASAFGIAGLLSVAGMIASGWLSARIGFRATATASFVLTFTGVAFLLLLSYEAASWLLAAFVLTFGLSQGARGPIVSTLAAQIFPGPGFATIFGTMFACMSVGAGLGSLASGVLHDVTGGYTASFVFSMVCVVVAGAPFWVSERLRGRPTGSSAA